MGLFVLACAFHPLLEAPLSCGKCGRATCIQCVVATEIGTRCRQCAPAPAAAIGIRDVLAGGLPKGAQREGLVRLGLLAVLLVVCPAAIAWSYLNGDREALVIRTVFYGGWLASVVLHEFMHGLAAYFGGDRSVRERGYLTLNPLKFVDPVFSVVMPVFFVLIGGLPLMGGRTIVHSHNLRSRHWDSAVSLAGPLTNLGLAIVITLVLRAGIVDPWTPLGAGLAFLALMEFAAAMFNLIPWPPLDGFGALAPYLPTELVAQARSLGYGGYFLLIAAFWTVPFVGDFFWDQVYTVASNLSLPFGPAWWGESQALFLRR